MELEIKDDQACIFRNEETGKTLTKAKGSSEKARAYLRFMFKGGVLTGFPAGSGTEVEVTEGLVAFKLPTVS